MLWATRLARAVTRLGPGGDERTDPSRRSLDGQSQPQQGWRNRQGSARTGVASHGADTSRSGDLIIAPLTTQSRPTLAPLRVALPVRERMLQPRFVMVEHVRAIDHDRLGDGPLLRLDAQELAQVETSLRAMLGLW